MAPPAGHLYYPNDGGCVDKALLFAAVNGDLHILKEIMKKLVRNGHCALETARSLRLDGSGFGLLYFAASHGHLEVCKYLVDDLGCDADVRSAQGTTPLMASAQFGDVETVKFFLDHGCDPKRSDANGATALHLAAAAGCCEVTEFLLSKGVPVDIDCGWGTPLGRAAYNGKYGTLKILLDHHANPNTDIFGVGTPLTGALFPHSLKCMELLLKAGADVNRKGFGSTPLIFAVSNGGYTDFIKFLLEAGVDPNIPDDFGTLPIEIAATRNCREEVELLFPLTSPIPTVPNWTVDGVISRAQSEASKPMGKGERERRATLLKSQADKATNRKAYGLASHLYGLAIDYQPSAALYANRSLCKRNLGDGAGALADARQCRTMRPTWPKACYRQGAAYMLLKEYRKACDALLDGLQLDPKNAEIEEALWKAVKYMKNPPEEAELQSESEYLA